MPLADSGMDTINVKDDSRTSVRVKSVAYEVRPAWPAFILSFDVEEHDRIEAATSLPYRSEMRQEYARRMADTTYRLLNLLAETGARATFFMVGEIARTDPQLVRAIARAGHEIGCHGWEHRRVHTFTPEEFRADTLRCKETLEQVTGQAVVGYRAPTFSIDHKTAWAIDILAECGFRYDSSIFPVIHDRYGVPEAPRMPFVVHGNEHSLLELPPATYRIVGENLPVAGGGYFRLFPLMVIQAGLAQLVRETTPPVGMLYFHPWEFDPGQPRLPLRPLARWRTYVGIRKSERRLRKLLKNMRFQSAIEVVEGLRAFDNLEHFHLTSPQPARATASLARI